ncbi:MAG TPA: hypothetical protein VIT46_08635 [Gaiellaceae bacterium]
MRWLLAVVALLVVTAGVGCGGERPDDAAAPREATEPPAQSSNRQAAPPLSGVTLDGDAIATRDFRGRPVLINVWSSW